MNKGPDPNRQGQTPTAGAGLRRTGPDPEGRGPAPLGLYVHLPWCVKKCPYCDFNSHTAGDEAPTARYVDALLRDIEFESERAGRRVVETVFLGGGTPSLFSTEEIGRILEAVRSMLSLARDAEITMEANPGTVECGTPAGYRDAGVNRLSIGAQSFDDNLLQVLGRVHASDDIRRAFAAARDGGFDNINLDLMHALPGQTIDMALADLDAAIDLGPEHMSWYQLTLEPNTVYYARPPANLPDSDTATDIQDAGIERLADSGYRRYEVSAYARDELRCRHNLNYWRFGDYLAVGAGAHGKFTDKGSISRYSKPANPLQYMQSMESGGEPDPGRPVDRRDLVFEYMLNALRLSDGFDEREFVAQTGLGADQLRNAAGKSLERGLIERTVKGIWRPTPLGARFLDDLAQEFLYAQD